MKRFKSALLAAFFMAVVPITPSWAQLYNNPNRGAGISFVPNFGTGVTLSVTTTSTSTTFTGIAVTSPDVYVANTGASNVYIRFGTGAQTATTADYLLIAGQAYVLTKGNANTLAVVTGAGASSLSVITGAGQ